MSGVYEGIITVSTNEFKDIEHKIKLIILDIQLPNSKDYKFHLDLWINQVP